MPDEQAEFAQPAPVDLPRDAIRLVVCGAAILFWELVLIRWLGASIRIVAYFTNFVLVAAFLGLGAGALLTGRRVRLVPILVPTIAASLMAGPVLGAFAHLNPTRGEYLWLGSGGTEVVSWLSFLAQFELPWWLVLSAAFAISAFVFLVFGQLLGELFRRRSRPLEAYSLEIGGSLAGIALFAMMSWLQLRPSVWFGLGFLLLLPLLELRLRDYTVLVVSAVLALVLCGSVERGFLWSPYYKIKLTRMERDSGTGAGPISWHSLTVNNDYHQRILDLSDGDGREPKLISDWRSYYEAPHRSPVQPPGGPILIVGAGTGNDVAAALRRSQAHIDAVEIDPVILSLGKRYHPERPYDSERVRIVNDDARSHLTRTDERYAKVVFGLLDSHTLFSSFSTLRLDNYVYTRQALERVKEVLLPGGTVYLSFGRTTEWLHARLVGLLEEVFDYPTVEVPLDANAVMFVNGRRPADPAAPPPPPLVEAAPHDLPEVIVPDDDWPFLYLHYAELPTHYLWFLGLVCVLSVSSLFLVPRGERQLRFPFFFMGAGFFLIETSNVVKLALLYGSTWVVNVTVFAGILVLVLLGNLASTFLAKDRYPLLFGLLLAWCGLSFLVHPSDLLGMQSRLLQGVVAMALFLGPIFLAALIFARLIRDDPSLPQAYGSNLLGAMVGGAAEYTSLLWGFQALVGVSMLFYALALMSLQLGRSGR